jgi:hypothetical protein
MGYNKAWYEKNREAQLRYVTRNNKRYKEKAREIIDTAKDVPCLDCGNKFPPVAMDFDHVRGIKIKDISQMMTCNPEKILAEIAKCEVVCACCHRIRTAARLSLMDKATAS